MEKKLKMKVGDVAIVIDNINGDPTHGGHSFQIGEIIEIIETRNDSKPPFIVAQTLQMDYWDGLYSNQNFTKLNSKQPQHIRW